jgi:hypothetical protein
MVWKSCTSPSETPALAAPGEVDIAVEERCARAIGAEPEILEITGVACVGQVSLDPQPVGKIGAMNTGSSTGDRCP